MARVATTGPDTRPDTSTSRGTEHIIEGIKTRYAQGEYDEATLERKLEAALNGEPEQEDVSAGLKAAHEAPLLEGQKVYQ